MIEFQVHAHLDDLRNLVVEHFGRQDETMEYWCA
jgi:hypothetical protein